MSSTDVGVVFDALADATRRRVLDTVATQGTATPTELADLVGVTRQAVAKHLAVLDAAGLVTATRAGREVRYQVVPGSLRPVAEWAQRTDAAWDDRLERLRRAMAARAGARSADR